jgi:hypothetical protein
VVGEEATFTEICQEFGKAEEDIWHSATLQILRDLTPGNNYSTLITFDRVKRSSCANNTGQVAPTIIFSYTVESDPQHGL